MKKNSCPSVNNPRLVGDPVDTLTGAVVDRILDFRLTGFIELRWYRHYDSSQSHRSFSLGNGWAHEYDRSLTIDEEGLLYEENVGRTFRFSPLNSDCEECAFNGIRVRRVSSVCYHMFRHAQPTMEFVFVPNAQRARLTRLLQNTHEVKFWYDGAQRLISIDDSAGRRLKAIEDEAKRLTHLSVEPTLTKPGFLLVAYHYDEQGNLIRTENDKGHGYAFEYDEANRLVQRRGRKGFKFYFKYDAQGRCIRSMGDDRLYGVALEYKVPGRYTKVTRPDLGVWHYHFTGKGGLKEIIDPLGGVQKYIRDESGRIALDIDPNGNVSKLIYDSAGEAIAKVDPLGHRIALPEDPNAPDPLSHRVAANAAEYEYGRLLDITTISLPSVEQARKLPLLPEVHALLSVQSKKIQKLISKQDIDVPPLRILWWPEPKSGRLFNDLGQLLRQQDDYGRLRQWTYDESGNIAEHVDFDGGKWKYDYGSWHYLRRLINPIGAQIRFSYTTYGEVTSCLDAGGTLSEYRYDLKDHLVEVKRHGIVRETYTRDAFGNLVAKHASDGRELLRFEIGPGNLPIKRTLASGDEHTFQYDNSGRHIVAETKKDRVEFAYDTIGNRILEKRNGLGSEHRYRSWRRPAESIYFGRFPVRYDWRGNTLLITDPGGKAHEIHFFNNGVVERFFSNGSQETSQYDNLGRCLFKCAQRKLGQVWSRSYHWSGEGELQKVEDNLQGGIHHEYDAAHRIRRRSINGRIENYEMDHADNLIAQPGLSGVTLQDGNRLKTANGFEFQYNDRNHIEARQNTNGSIRYTYDSRDQLIHVEMPKGIWKAEYDALGRRIRKTWADQTTEFYWNTDQLLAELNPEGRLRLYVYSDPLALTPLLFLEYNSIDSSLDSGRRYFIFSDQIGTPCLIEDEGGNEIWRARIAPFGQAEIVLGAQIEFNLRFPGHSHDPEIELYYNRFRYFDPMLGRYIQSDPWGLGGGYNVYAYRINPLLTSDVRGLGEDGKDGCKPKDDEEIPPGMSKKEFDDLKAEMKDRADSAWQKMKEANERGDRTVTLDDGTVLKTSDTGMGPCLSVVKDLKTGEIFYGQNTGKQPENMAPLLQDRTDAVAAANQAKSPAPEGYPPGWSRDKGIPGSHSEVQALNQGMQARPGSEPGDFAVHNVRTQDNKNGNAGDPMPRCDNCKPITDGIVPLTD